MQPGNLEIVQEQNGNVTVVRPRGAVNIETSSRFHEELMQLVRRKAPAVLVSLRELERMDTSGLAALIDAAQQLQACGGTLAVSELDGELTDDLSLAQVRSAFPTFASEQEALAELGTSGNRQDEDGQ